MIIRIQNKNSREIKVPEYLLKDIKILKSLDGETVIQTDLPHFIYKEGKGRLIKRIDKQGNIERLSPKDFINIKFLKLPI
jgi:hypothetical protein